MKAFFNFFHTLALSFIASAVKSVLTSYETSVLNTGNVVAVSHHNTEIWVTDGRWIYLNNYPSSVTRKRQNQISNELRLSYGVWQADFVTYFGVMDFKTDLQFILIDTEYANYYAADKVAFKGSDLMAELKDFEPSSSSFFGYELLNVKNE